MERTKRGLITHELTSIIIFTENIRKELDKIDKVLNNIEKLNNLGRRKKWN